MPTIFLDRSARMKSHVAINLKGLVKFHAITVQIVSRQRVGLGFHRKGAPDEPEILDLLLTCNIVLATITPFFILMFASTFYHLQHCIRSLLILTFIESTNIRFLLKTQLTFSVLISHGR